MTITFPINHPTTGISALEFGPNSVVGVTESPFTLEQQVQEHQGEGWAGRITVSPMADRDIYEPWMAFLTALRGRRGTFLFGDPTGATPRGVATGTPVAGSTIPTWNPADKGANVVLSNANRTAFTDVAVTGAVRATAGIDVVNEARYFEFDAIVGGSVSSAVAIGIANSSHDISNPSPSASNVRTYASNGWRRGGGASNIYGAAWNAGSPTRIGVAIKSGSIWFAQISGGVTTWQGGGDPVGGTNPAFSGLTGTWYPYATDGSLAHSLTVDLITDPAGMLGQMPDGFASFVGENTARSRVLYTTGWTPNTTGILKAGDWLQLGSGASARLHKNLTDASSDGSGNAVLDIWPALREDVADGAAITVRSAKGVFRLADSRPRWTLFDGVVAAVQFEIVEAL